MGWDTVRVSLYPCDRTFRLEDRNNFDQTLRIVHNVEVEGFVGSRCLVEETHRLLLRLNFDKIRAESAWELWHYLDVNAEVSRDGEYVKSIILEFRLCRTAISRLREWQQIVDTLSNHLDLTLGDYENEMHVSSMEFVRLITGTDNWRDFSEAFGWSEG